jgi:hypothetical protein
MSAITRVSLAWTLTAAAVLLLTACTTSSEEQTAPSETAAPQISAPAGADTAVRARRTDFQVTYQLDGTSVASESVGLSSHPQLRLEATVPAGATVERGERVGRLRIDPEVASLLQGSAQHSSIDASRLAQLRALQGPAEAPVTGVLHTAPQAAIEALGVDVVVELSPVQTLRYQALQFTGRAAVETVMGTREVPCAAVWVSAPATSSQPSAGAADTGGDQASTLHCRLPRQVETAPGLRAGLILTSRPLPDVLVVPNLFVGYDAERDGYYVIIRDHGRTRTLDVTVGPTDGVLRVLTSPVPVDAPLVMPKQAL